MTLRFSGMTAQVLSSQRKPAASCRRTPNGAEYAKNIVFFWECEGMTSRFWCELCANSVVPLRSKLCSTLKCI
jgi:hypothetical protein